MPDMFAMARLCCTRPFTDRLELLRTQYIILTCLVVHSSTLMGTEICNVVNSTHVAKISTAVVVSDDGYWREVSGCPRRREDQ